MVLQLKIIGLVLIVLALVHFVFPKYFHWEKELRGLSLVNKQIMYVHTFFIGLVVFLIGILCFFSPIELIETNLGKQISLGFAIFWSARLWIQFFGYSSELWRGKFFETSVHIVFVLLWSYLSVIFWKIFLT